MIDQRIRYKEGSNKPERPKHEKLNGNVFSIFPIPHERPWHLDTPKEDNGDEETGVKNTRRYASHDPEALAYEYWLDRYLEHPLKDKFQTLKDFISWSLSNEDQPFHKGGRVGIESIDTPFYKAVKSGKVGLQFVPPRKNN